MNPFIGMEMLKTATLSAVFTAVGTGTSVIDQTTHIPVGWVLGGFVTAAVAAFWAGNNYKGVNKQLEDYGKFLEMLSARLGSLENELKAQKQNCIKHYETYYQNMAQHCEHCGHKSLPYRLRDERDGHQAGRDGEPSGKRELPNQ